MNVLLTGAVKSKQALKHFWKDNLAVTAIEYAILAVAVSAIVYSVFGASDSSLKTALSGAMSTVTSNIDASNSSGSTTTP